jgi:hypothetical protein
MAGIAVAWCYVWPLSSLGSINEPPASLRDSLEVLVGLEGRWWMAKWVLKGGRRWWWVAKEGEVMGSIESHQRVAW